MNGSHFEVALNEHGRPLVIRDVGHDQGCRSVTNDAESVVALLYASGLLDTHRRLFYYDSENNLDEILHHDGRFVGFAPGAFAEGKRPNETLPGD